MNDDMFFNRDRFVELFSKVFKESGWKTEFHRSERYWSFLRSFSDFNVTTSFSGRHMLQLTRNPRVDLAAGLSKQDLDAILQKIMPPIRGHAAQPAVVASCQIKEEIPALQGSHEAFVLGISDQIIHWAESQDIEACIESFASPWATEKQATHLAALAYVGNFNTLMDYQEMFQRGQRANFYPIIKREMIDRAYDIALERA